MLSSRRKNTATRAKFGAGETRAQVRLLPRLDRIPVEFEFPGNILDGALATAPQPPKVHFLSGEQGRRRATKDRRRTRAPWVAGENPNTRMRSTATAVSTLNWPSKPHCGFKYSAICLNLNIHAASSHVCGLDFPAAVLKTRSTLPLIGSKVFYGGMKWFC